MWQLRHRATSWAWERASTDTAVNAQDWHKHELSFESTDQMSLGWGTRREQGQPTVWLSGDITGPMNIIVLL